MTASVLIVDDSLTVRMDLAEAFEAEEFHVYPCATLSEARQTLASATVEIIVLDVRLPDGDGVDFLAELRASDGNPRVVLMLSTEAEVKDRIRALQTGADEYVGKPYDADYMVARARELLGARRGVTELPERPTLLLIDDSLTVRDQIRGALEGAGYAVLTAGTGEEGLRLAALRRPAGVVVDGHLPGIDGATVIRRIRLDQALRTLPCILLTGSQDRTAELATLDAGADAFVHKGEPIDVLLARVAAVLRGQQPAARTASVLGPHKVLAVDDSPTYLDELAAALQGEGYDVALARTGEEALSLLAVQPVDCILLDMMMPGMGGCETCRRIKSAPAVRHIPLIMLTSLDDHQSMMEGFDAGVDDYVSKACDLEVLKARVRAQLRRKHFEDEKRRIHDQLLDKEVEASEARAAHELAEARNLLIEELERKNQQLEAANHIKRDFLATMSHEIRTPLNAVLGLTYLALRTELTVRQRNYLHEIHGAGQSLLAIVNDILDFSKGEAGRIELERIELHLDEVLNSLASILARKASEKGLELLVSVAPDVPMMLLGDPLRLGQVLLNLVGNAIKFTAEGEVLISIKLDSAFADTIKLRLQVKDSGVGLTPEETSRLFGAFSQANVATARKHGGTGLGLAICKQMVELMQGEIAVESIPGKGSTFSFTAVFGRSYVTRKFPSPSLKGLTAVVIDHNETRRNILCSALGTLSVVSKPLSSLETGLAEIASSKSRYDLVLIDAQVLSGRARKWASRPFSILVDDRSHEDLDARAAEMGVCAVLLKPITLSDLHDVILNVLGGTELRRRNYEPVDRKGLDEAMAAVRGARVLLAEDNAINQQIARELLQSAGMTVDIVDNGKQAVERVLGTDLSVAGCPWDAILMDLQMPVMDGYAACSAIRRDERFRDLPILAMTAHVLSEERDKCHLAGMDDYISKPIEPETMFATLGRWFPTRDNPEPAPLIREFPEIVGINVQDGLRRVAGNGRLYRTLLLELASQREQTSSALEAALVRGDMVTLDQLAHTLKGLAGNLGIESVQSHSQTLESLARHQEVAQARQCIGPLIQAFEEVCRDILIALPERFA